MTGTLHQKTSKGLSRKIGGTFWKRGSPETRKTVPRPSRKSPKRKSSYWTGFWSKWTFSRRSARANNRLRPKKHREVSLTRKRRSLPDSELPRAAPFGPELGKGVQGESGHVQSDAPKQANQQPQRNRPVAQKWHRLGLLVRAANVLA